MVTLLSISYFSLSVLALTFAPDHILSLSPIPVPRPLIRTLRKFLCPTASYIGSLVLRHFNQRLVDVATDSRSWNSYSTLLARSVTLWIARSRCEGLEGAQDTKDNSLSASSRVNCTSDYIGGSPRVPTADPSDTDADLIPLPGGWPAGIPDDLQAESADVPTGLQLCLERDCGRGHLYSAASEEACAITSAGPGCDVAAAPGGVVLSPAQLVSAYTYEYYPVRLLLVTARVRTRPHSVQVLLYLEDIILVLHADSPHSDAVERLSTARSAQPLGVVLDLIVRSPGWNRSDGVGRRAEPISHTHNHEHIGTGAGDKRDCGALSATALETDNPESAGASAALHAPSLTVRLFSDPSEEVAPDSADVTDCYQEDYLTSTLCESESPPPTFHQLEDADGLPLSYSLRIATADDSGNTPGLTEIHTCVAAGGVGGFRSQQGDHHVCEQQAYSVLCEEFISNKLCDPAPNVEATSPIHSADAEGCERDVDIATTLREFEAVSTPPTFRQPVQVDDLPLVDALRIADADQGGNTPRSTDTKTREAADSLAGLHADHRQQSRDHVWEQADLDQDQDLTLDSDAISTADDQNVDPDTTLGPFEFTPVTTQDGLNGIGVFPFSEDLHVAADSNSDSDSDAFSDPPGPLHRDSNPDHSDGDADVIPVVTTDLPPIEPLNALGQGATALASAALPEPELADSDLRPSPQLNFPLSRRSTVNSLRATMVSTVVWKESHSPVSSDFASCSSRSDGGSRLEQAEDASTARAPEADRDHDADTDWQSNSPTSPSKRYPYIMRAVSQPRRRRLALAVTERDVDIRARPHTYSYEPPPTPTRISRAPTPPLLSLMPHLKDGSDLSVDTFETCVTSRFSGSSTPSTSTSASRSVSLRQESSQVGSTLDLSSDLFGDFDLPELPAPSSASVGGAIHEVPSLDLPSGLFEPFALPELSFSSYPSSSSSSAFPSDASILASADPVGSPETERKVPTELPRVVFPSSEAASESLDEASSDQFHTFQSSYAESVRSTSRYTDSLAQFGTRVGKETEKWWRSLSLKTRPISVSVSDSASAHSKTSTKLKLKRLVSLSAVRGFERRSSLKEKRATWDGRGESVQEDAEMGFLGHSGSTTTGLGSGALAAGGLGRRGKRKTALSLRSTASASTCASTPSAASGDSGSVRGMDVRMLPRYA